MKKKDYDFSGWATVHGIKCSDGRIIHKDAFKENDGKVVPLIWNHKHDEQDNVLGHALLENKEKGVYAYCSLNDTERGKNAKELIKHGDVCALSIYANKLIQKGSDVTQGMIREVSLVLAGANPGAFIDNVILHGEISNEEATIYNEEEAIEIVVHSDVDETLDKNETTVPESDPKPDPEVTDPKPEPEAQKPEPENPTKEDDDGKDPKSDNSSEVAKEGQDPLQKPDDVDKIQHKEGEDETVEEIFNSLTDKQKTVMYIILADALNTESTKEVKKETMNHNAFETKPENGGEVHELTHSELIAVIAEAKKGNSLRDVLHEACLSHGITNVENLFPDARAVSSAPKSVDINTDWVAAIMNGVKHTPFARIKSSFFDLTAEEARAAGYVKGDKKVEEVLVAIKRTTDPQTVYKLQKMDRDDVIDIVDFDVVAWLKSEMRGKLEQELARGFLFGDGRSAASPLKIDPLKIRPVVSDDAIYSVQVAVAGSKSSDVAENLVDQMVEAQLLYKGSGNITAFVRDDIFTKMLLLKDTNKHRLYKTKDELATSMNVNRVIKVPASVMGSCYAVALDLSDYNVGADKGGAVSLFDDFDINYNKMEYLIETRCSGANVTPYSALVFSAAVVPAGSSSAK